MKKLLTIEDLRNPSLVSGFNRVFSAGGKGKGHGGGKPWKAAWMPTKTNPGDRWGGPRRATPEEAAQDYCDYINGNNIVSNIPLKTVAHPAPPKRAEPSDEERELRARLREIEEEKNKGRQGYVYVMAMENNAYAVKVGFSYDPPSRPRGMQGHNPYVLVVMAYFPGTEEDEKRLHQKYIRDNVQREWFRPTVQLLSEFGLTWADYQRTVFLAVKEEAA